MIKIENEQVLGWDHAIRGMRNPLNSWQRSDSGETDGEYVVGTCDLALMTTLGGLGPVHAKYRRMIVVYVDITAPLYWWKEFDTYKVGTVANSCSTMHQIHAKPFELDDFSHEHLIGKRVVPDHDYQNAYDVLGTIIACLNFWRDEYNLTKDKAAWWQMIQLLPASYNQRRTVMLNYEVLAGIYPMRKNHKLDEWHEFCKWIEKLPYSEIITKEIL